MNRKILFKRAMLLLPICFFISTIKAQDQIINADFENWETVADNEQEPVQWNSFRTNGGSMAGLAKAKQVAASPVVRPGSQGTASAVIWTRNVLFGILANGNLTTGQIQAGSMTPTNVANHNKTIRDNANFNMPFTSKPDSLTVWTRYVPKNTTHQARVAAVIHGDLDYQDPNNNAEMETFVAGKALLNYSAAAGNVWQRLSVPFDYNFASDDMRYIQITFTANMTPGGGSANDSVYIDDMLMIYKPTLTAENASGKSIFMTGEKIEIAYTITGTMSPYNLNAVANTVRLELSDKAGVFDNATVLDEITTNESGVFVVALPKEIEAGRDYKLRVVTTNYPMISNEISIEMMEIAAPLATFKIKWTDAVITPPDTDTGKGTVHFDTVATDEFECHETYFTFIEGLESCELYLNGKLLEMQPIQNWGKAAYVCDYTAGFEGLLQVVKPASKVNQIGKKKGLGDTFGGGVVIAEYDLIIKDISTGINSTGKELQAEECFAVTGIQIPCNTQGGTVIKKQIFTDGSINIMKKLQ